MEYNTAKNLAYASGLIQALTGGFIVAALSSEDFGSASIAFGGYLVGGILYRAFNNTSRGDLKDEINDLERKVEELKQ